VTSVLVAVKKYIKYITIFSIIIIITVVWILYQKDKNYNPVREKYVKEEIERIKNIKPTEFIDITPFYEVRFQEKDKLLYYQYAIRDKTAIKCKDGSWVYFSLRDGHFRMPGEKYDIGSVALAIDSNGNIFVSYHHFCGAICIGRKGPKDYFESSKNIEGLFKKIN